MLQIEVSLRNAGDANATIIDGSALLWTIHWPADRSVADFGVNVKIRIIKYLTNSNVYNHHTPVRGIYKRIYKRDVIHQATCFISAKENIGWKKDEKTSLSPTLLPDQSKPAPDYILE